MVARGRGSNEKSNRGNLSQRASASPPLATPPTRAIGPPRPAGADPMDRGRRPPEAENRARQIRGKLVWHRTAALGFGRLRRPRRPRPRGESVGSAKHTPTARRTHLRPRPAPDGTSKGNFWEKQGTNQSGAVVGSQRELVGETERTTPTPPRRGATHNSADFGDYSRARPSARGKRNWQGV